MNTMCTVVVGMLFLHSFLCCFRFDNFFCYFFDYSFWISCECVCNCVLRFRFTVLFLLLLLWRLANAFIDHYMQLSTSPHLTPLWSFCVLLSRVTVCMCLCIMCKCVIISLYSWFTSIHSKHWYSILFYIIFLLKYTLLYHTDILISIWCFLFSSVFWCQRKASLPSLHLNIMYVTFVRDLLLLFFSSFIDTFLFSFKIKWLLSFHCLLFILAWISSSRTWRSLIDTFFHTHCVMVFCVCTFVCVSNFHLVSYFCI